MKEYHLVCYDPADNLQLDHLQLRLCLLSPFRYALYHLYLYYQSRTDVLYYSILLPDGDLRIIKSIPPPFSVSLQGNMVYAAFKRLWNICVFCGKIFRQKITRSHYDRKTIDQYDITCGQ